MKTRNELTAIAATAHRDICSVEVTFSGGSTQFTYLCSRKIAESLELQRNPPVLVVGLSGREPKFSVGVARKVQTNLTSLPTLPEDRRFGWVLLSLFDFKDPMQEALDHIVDRLEDRQLSKIRTSLLMELGLSAQEMEGLGLTAPSDYQELLDVVKEGEGA